MPELVGGTQVRARVAAEGGGLDVTGPVRLFQETGHCPAGRRLLLPPRWGFG